MTKKICFFLGHYDPARQVIMEYYEKIFPQDVEFYIVCANKFDKEKYPLKRTKVIEILDPKMIVPFKLRKFLKEKDIDLVINLTGEAEVALIFFISTLFSKTKNILYFLGNPKNDLRMSFFLFFQFFTSGILFICKEISDKFKKFLFFKRKSIFYIPFPINTNIFKPMNKKVMRKKFGFKEKDKILFYVGRIEPEQGSDYLLDLIKKNPEKKFILIGQLRDKNFEDNKFENVTHIPFVPNKELPYYYNLADITLFFSKRNAYPYPPRESLACEVPVILFNLNTFGQLKTDAVKKVPFNIEKIQEEINSLFMLPKKEKETLVKEGRKFIIEDSSEEKIKKKTLEYFSNFKMKENYSKDFFGLIWTTLLAPMTLILFFLTFIGEVISIRKYKWKLF